MPRLVPTYATRPRAMATFASSTSPEQPFSPRPPSSGWATDAAPRATAGRARRSSEVRVVRRIPEDEGAEPAAGSLRGTAYMRRWNHQGRHAYIFVGDDGDSAIPFAVQRSGGARMELTYFGHASFLLRAGDGTTILIDPYDTSVGYPLPDVAATAVTVAHEHSDHNHVQTAKGSPKVIRGLVREGKEWAKVEERVGQVRLTTVPTVHDPSNGAGRGRNPPFIFEVDGVG